MAVVISLVCGLAVAFAMMSIARSHNPQGEIYLDGHVDWGYWLQIGFGWFVVTILTLLLPTFTGAFLWYRFLGPLVGKLMRRTEVSSGRGLF
jgi:hypothetical protein